MLGYTEATIERKAAKRGITAEQYKAILIQKRQTRAARHNAAVAEKRAEAEAQKRAKVRT
jgi:hypothetical protein